MNNPEFYAYALDTINKNCSSVKESLKSLCLPDWLTKKIIKQTYFKGLETENISRMLSSVADKGKQVISALAYGP